MFQRLWHTLTKRHSPASTKPGRRRFRPALEVCEDRCLPSTFSWFQPVDGDFNDPSRWRDQNGNPGVPSMGDDAVINAQRGITVTSSMVNSVHSLEVRFDRLKLTGSTFSVANDSIFGSLVLLDGATLQATGGTTLVCYNGGFTTLAGRLDVAPGATLNIGGGAAAVVDINAGAVLSGAGRYRLGDGTYRVNDALMAPANFEQTGGTLTGPGNFTVPSPATFTWSGGTMSGTGTTEIQAGGTLILNGDAGKGYSRTITNAGMVNWTGAGSVGGGGALFNNLAGGTINFSAQSAGIVNWGGGGGLLNNAGTFTKTSNSADFSFGLSVNNRDTGTVNVQGGVLRLDAGGTSTGTFATATGGILAFGGGTYTLNDGASLTDAGQYRLDGATLTVNANVTLANFTQNNGTLTGPGTLTVTAALTWTRGTMSGDGTTTSGANLFLSGDAGKVLSGRTFNNQGAATWSQGGNFDVSNSAVFYNTGTFNIQNDQTLSGNGTIVNTNSWTKNSATDTGITTVTPLFNNTGTVTVNRGVLQLNGGGTNTGTFDTGTFATAEGRIIAFGGGTYKVNTGAMAGNGLYRLDFRGTLVFNADVTLANFTQAEGALTGPGTLTVIGTLTWTGGTMSGDGTTISSATLTLNGNGTLSGRTFNNAGTATWMGTGNYSVGESAVFKNTDTGTFNILNDQFLGSFGSPGTVNNMGTWTKTSPAGSGTTRIDALFNNTGMVSVTSGVLQLNNGGTSTGIFSIAADSSVKFAGGTYTLDTRAGASFTGAGFGRVVAGGTVNVNGTVTAANFALESGTLTGTGELAVSGSFDWTGGVFADPNGSFTLLAGATLTIRGPDYKGIAGRTLNLADTANWEADSGDLNLSNAATINVLSGGTFNILNSGRNINGGYFSNAGGVVSVLAGTHRIDDYTQSDGTTDVSSGATLASGGTVNILGGVLSGTGTVSADVLNAGRVSPGGDGAAGTLTIMGNYTQTATGVLTIELGPSIDQYDRLVITGTATLDGTLDVSLIGGFMPDPDSAFQILTFSSRPGSTDFAVKTGLDLGGGRQLMPTFDPMHLTLVAS